jgi:hypothetical protein
MLYIGHFSFIVQISAREEFCGRFTCLAKAKDAGDALRKFKEHLQERMESGALFEGKALIYLDDLIELHKEPENAIAFNFRSLPDLAPPSTVCPVLSVNSEGFRIRAWETDDKNGSDEFDSHPVMNFEGPRSKPKGRHLKLIK